MKKTAMIVIIVTLLSKVLGMLRDVLLAYFYGASVVSDAFIISLTIPTVIFGFIGSGISTGFIPMFTKIQKHDGDKEAEYFVNNLLNIFFVIFTVILVILYVYTDKIVLFFAPGFNSETLELAVSFTRITLFNIYFLIFVNIFMSYLQIKGNYVVPALIGLPMNIILVLFTIVSFYTNVKLLAIGGLLSIISQAVFLLPYIKRKGYIYKPVVNFKNKYIKELIIIIIPVIFGSAANQINILIDKSLASQFAVGSITALDYANKLNLFTQGVFVAPITALLYPTLAKSVVEDDKKQINNVMVSTINNITITIIPLSVGMMLFSKEITDFLYGRGTFDETAILMTASALFYYTIGMFANGIRDVFSRTFYSYQDTKTPMMVGGFTIFLNITFNYLLSRYIGISGIALSSSIATIVGAILLYIILKKKMSNLSLIGVKTETFKIIIGSVIMGIISKSFYNWTQGSISKDILLFLAVLLGVLVYAIVLILLKSESLIEIINILRRKKSKENKDNM